MQPQQTGQAPYQQARPAGQMPMAPVPVQPMQAALYQQVRQQPLPPVAQVQRPAFTPAARLPLPSSRSLARGWQKFVQIIRYGKVGTPSGTEPVQQVSLLWTAGGIDSRQLGAEVLEVLDPLAEHGLVLNRELPRLRSGAEVEREARRRVGRQYLPATLDAYRTLRHHVAQAASSDDGEAPALRGRTRRSCSRRSVWPCRQRES